MDSEPHENVKTEGNDCGYQFCSNQNYQYESQNDIQVPNFQQFDTIQELSLTQLHLTNLKQSIDEPNITNQTSELQNCLVDGNIDDLSPFQQKCVQFFERYAFVYQIKALRNQALETNNTFLQSINIQKMNYGIKNDKLEVNLNLHLYKQEPITYLLIGDEEYDEEYKFETPDSQSDKTKDDSIYVPPIRYQIKPNCIECSIQVLLFKDDDQQKTQIEEVLQTLQSVTQAIQIIALPILLQAAKNQQYYLMIMFELIRIQRLMLNFNYKYTKQVNKMDFIQPFSFKSHSLKLQQQPQINNLFKITCSKFHFLIVLQKMENFLALKTQQFIQGKINEQKKRYQNQTSQKYVFQFRVAIPELAHLIRKYFQNSEKFEPSYSFLHQKRVDHAQFLRQQKFDIGLSFTVQCAENALNELEKYMKLGRKQFLAPNVSRSYYLFKDKFSKKEKKLHSYAKITKYQLEQDGTQFFNMKITTSNEFVDKIYGFFDDVYLNDDIPLMQQIKTTVASGQNTIKLIEEKLNVKREVFMHKKPSITTTKAGMEVLSFWVKSQYYEQIQLFINECTVKEPPKQKQKKYKLTIKAIE
ncbi:Hypothetical_protein [Hexamita inflata]|uniref:Hypothetical_protein n=1 Tax=Hexamita inflata TaxID=28002 RepID=A0AA86R7S6_9EUKA|nr:Hypothetical protein HINF_LOCUS60636 [Hexamita inflata]